MKSHLLAVVFVALNTVVSKSTFSPARPPAIPLAVKSPYMNTWLEVGSDGGSGGGNLAGSWPRFWAGAQPGPVAGSNGAVTGWVGMIKVDGASYTWMGAPSINGLTPALVFQESFEYTSQRSTFIMNVAGKVTMNITFLSPITPTDLKKMSIIGTYLSVSVASRDEETYSVQLYADTSAEWVNPTHSGQAVQWNYTSTNGVASHKSCQQAQSEFNVDYPDDSAHWGNWYWSTAAVSSMTYQNGGNTTVWQKFLSDGVLSNTQESNDRASKNNNPVSAFANALGNVGTTPVTTLYTIVHAQQNAVYFGGAHGIVGVPSLWNSYFNSDLAMVEFFYKDYATQVGSIDHVIAVDSLAAGGQDYLTITSLSARQAFAAVQLAGTIAKPYLFLKEISSDGNMQTVDVIFPTMPIFLYSNPALIKYLLDPLFENQEAGHFPQTYSLHDLGENYPQAIGHPFGNGEYMPLEECGNMVITTLAYAQRANDNAYLAKHYKILKQWTDYLVQEALIPSDQLSTDDFQGKLANQTNLALKGIIGIQAMSDIASRTGNTADARNFSNIAHIYMSEWQKLAVVTDAGAPHTNLNYQNASSHGLLYNLYGDKLLNLSLVPQSIYDMQSKFYPTVAQTYGVPLDTRNVFTKSDWQMWAAAIASPSTRQMFISKLAAWIKRTSTNRAFTDLYNTQTGDFAERQFVARSVVGGHFALLALNGGSSSSYAKKEARGFRA